MPRRSVLSACGSSDAGRAARQRAQAGGVRSGGGPGQGESGGGSAEDGTTGRLHDSSTLRQSKPITYGTAAAPCNRRPVCGSRQSVPASNIERSWASSTPTTSVSSGSDPAAIADAPPASSSPMRAAVWPPASWPCAAYSSSLDAGVGDVEVAHRELTDPVDRPERGVLGALHGQLLRVVREVRARGCRRSCSRRRAAAAASPRRSPRSRPSAAATRAASATAGRASGPRRAAGRGGAPPGGRLAMVSSLWMALMRRS